MCGRVSHFRGRNEIGVHTSPPSPTKPLTPQRQLRATLNAREVEDWRRKINDFLLQIKLTTADKEEEEEGSGNQADDGDDAKADDGW